MENRGHEDHVRRPELDRTEPSEVFTYARDMQRWYRNRMSDRHLSDALDHLANELDDHVSQLFDAGPELEVQASTLHGPQLMRINGDNYQINSSPSDLEGDAALLGLHTVTGKLYGFHHAKVDDVSQLCVYVQRDEKPVKLRAGIYMPLWSVPVEGAEIHFAQEKETELLRKLGGFVTALTNERSIPVNAILKELLGVLDNSRLTVVDRLRQSETMLVTLLHEEGLSEYFSDTALDIISHKLQLGVPLSVHASSHRIVTSTPSVKSFNRGGEKEFHGVVPQLEMMGESINRSLGLFFYNEDKAVQVPVRTIKAIRRIEL